MSITLTNNEPLEPFPECILDDAWNWLDDNGYDPSTMFSGNVRMVDAAWRAALASVAGQDRDATNRATTSAPVDGETR